MSPIKGPIIPLLIISFLLIFLHLTFNPTLSTTYLYMVVGIAVAVLADQFVFKNSEVFPIEREGTAESRIKALAWAGAIYGVMNVAIGYLKENFLTTTQSVTQLLSTNMPLLQENTILSVISYGGMIPFLETYLINVIGLWITLQVISSFAPATIKQNFWENFKNIYIWIAVLLMMGVFIMYHIQVRGLDPTATGALAITGLFSVISSWMVIGFREGIQAILLHNLTNTIAILVIAGVL